MAHLAGVVADESDRTLKKARSWEHETAVKNSVVNAYHDPYHWDVLFHHPSYLPDPAPHHRTSPDDHRTSSNRSNTLPPCFHKVPKT